MNPAIAAAAVKVTKDVGGYVSNIGQAVLDSPEDKAEIESKLRLPKGSIDKMAAGQDDPKLSTVLGIATVLGVSVDKMTGFVAERKVENAKKREIREQKKEIKEQKKEEKALEKAAKKEASEPKAPSASDAERKLEQQNESLKVLKANLSAMAGANKDPKTEKVINYVDSYIEAMMKQSGAEMTVSTKQHEATKQADAEKAKQAEAVDPKRLSMMKYDTMQKNCQEIAEDKGLLTDPAEMDGPSMD